VAALAYEWIFKSTSSGMMMRIDSYLLGQSDRSPEVHPAIQISSSTMPSLSSIGRIPFAVLLLPGSSFG